MKIKEGFLLRQVAGETVVVPTGGVMDLNMMITLNPTGEFLWKALQEETTQEALTEALLAEYDVDKAIAEADVAAFVEKLNANGILQ